MSLYGPHAFGIDIPVCIAILRSVTPLESTTFKLETELIAALRELRRRDGVPATESVRRAIRAWLDQKGVEVEEGVKAQKESKAKTPRKRAVTRRRG